MIRTIAATLLFIGFASPAAAQPDPHHPDQAPAQGALMPGPMMGQGMMMKCPMTGMGMMGSENPRTEGRLAFLKAELKITESQDKAWTAYADTLRSLGHRKGPMGPGMMGQRGMGAGMMQGDPSISAPDTLKKRIEFMENHLKDLKKIQSATAKLYATLDETQKKTADDLLGMPCGMSP